MSTENKNKIVGKIKKLQNRYFTPYKKFCKISGLQIKEETYGVSHLNLISLKGWR